MNYSQQLTLIEGIPRDLKVSHRRFAEFAIMNQFERAAVADLLLAESIKPSKGPCAQQIVIRAYLDWVDSGRNPCTEDWADWQRLAFKLMKEQDMLRGSVRHEPSVLHIKEPGLVIKVRPDTVRSLQGGPVFIKLWFYADMRHAGEVGQVMADVLAEAMMRHHQKGRAVIVDVFHGVLYFGERSDQTSSQVSRTALVMRDMIRKAANDLSA